MLPRRFHLHIPIFAFAFVGFGALALAQSVPHQYGCRHCHTLTVQPSADPRSETGNANVCFSCHNPGAQAAGTALAPDDKADPFLSHKGSSHAWEVVPDNPSAGAQYPLNTVLGERLKNGLIVCTTCHDPHSHEQGAPFLRATNDGDALCLDCHRSRRMGPWSDNPAINIGSHPVEIAIPADLEAFTTPQAGGLDLPTSEGNVVCTTCHAAHFAPSTMTLRYQAAAGATDAKSATIAGAAWEPDAFAGWELHLPGSGPNLRQRRFVAGNSADTLRWAQPLPAPVATSDTLVLLQPGPGDGNLLRGPTDARLCQSCHTYPDHPHSNPVFSCETCHVAHGTDNILLVAPEIDGKPITYAGRSAAELVHGAPNYDGVCEVCHTNTRYHRNNPSGNHDHNAGSLCTECHLHQRAFASNCADCHEGSPSTLTTGSHPMHFTAVNGPQLASCDACHGPGAASGVHAGHRNGVVNFGGEDQQTLAATAVCDECHSPRGGYDGVDNPTVGAKPNWQNGVYANPDQLKPGLDLWCVTCHDDDPQTPENESSFIQALYAPGVSGDQATFGFYVTGHGRTGSPYSGESWQPEGANGNPPAALQCVACHAPGTAHIDGTPQSAQRLRPELSGNQSGSACAPCHDPGGSATTAPNYYVDSASYGASRHGSLQCSACHDVHGVASPAAAMARGVEEALCYTCHETVQDQFAGVSHHDVDDGQQVAHGSRVECTQCHNPHLASDTAPTVDPDDLVSSWTSSVPEFCKACHDGTPPPGVQFPATAPGEGWDQREYDDHPHSNPTNTCTDCHSPHGSTNLLLVQPEIAGSNVVFTERGVGAYTQGQPDYNGVCEVCHTQTRFHRGDASGDHNHGLTTACVECHLHKTEFLPNCGACHEATPETLTTGSHATHFTSPLGPEIISCDPCHGPGAETATHPGHLNGQVNFIGGPDDVLAATTACDECHSPAGLADGVAEAKPAWSDGVYELDGRLRAGHERWCLGCHDDDPRTPATNESARIDGIYAPPIGGDGQAYGYYVTGHGRTGTRYPSMSWQATGAQGNPAASLACDWCHDIQSPHIDGVAGSQLRFKPGFAPDQTNNGCNQCHQPGGPAYSTPTYFTTSAAFETSAHAQQLCIDCHNPHGTAGPNAAMSLAAEESLCYTCHTSTEDEFAKANHHDVAAADQAAHNSRVECTLCHNPHIITRDQPLVNPDNLLAVWTQTSPRDFCLACHDAAAPAAVRFPATSPGTGWNQSRFVGTRHDVVLGGDCTLCHNAHGSDFRSTLLANYTVTDNASASQAAYQACFNCHDYSKTIDQQNAFYSRHQLHVVSERGPCITCHNAHGPHDAAESGLIDYNYALTHGFDFSLTVDTTTYDLSTSFADLGVDRGRCYLRCHGHSHNPESYVGTSASTVDCLLCHETNP